MRCVIVIEEAHQLLVGVRFDEWARLRQAEKEETDVGADIHLVHSIHRRAILLRMGAKAEAGQTIPQGIPEAYEADRWKSIRSSERLIRRLSSKY